MAIRSSIAAVIYIFFAATALAQTTQPAEPATEATPEVEVIAEGASEAVPEGAAGATEHAAADADAEIESLKVQIKALLEETQTGATDLVRKVSGAETLSDVQIAGIALGIVAGAAAADALGGGGLVTIALAAGGGVLGNWIAGQF